MHIYIPTMRRARLQYTLQELQHQSTYPVTLVTPYDEYDDYKDIYPDVDIISPPPEVQRIAATRQWIMEQASDEKVVMMDDDLTFAARLHKDPEKFGRMLAHDYKQMLDVLNFVLDKYHHGGISIREGANRNTAPIVSCQRMCRVIAYRRSTFFREGVDFRNNTVMDDFEATLHLLTRGYPNGIVNSYVQNQKGSGTKGGASTYRDLAMHADAASRLQARYPDFVNLVEKTTKTAWGGQTRTDVIIQWKRALAYGQSNKSSRVLDTGEGSDSGAEGSGAEQAMVS